LESDVVANLGLQVAGFDDETKVDDNDLAMVAEHEIKDAVGTLLPEDYDAFAKLKKPAAKRKAPGGREPKAKKPKPEADLSLGTLRAMSNEGKLNKMTVTNMKAFLELQGETPVGRKAQLIDQIVDFFAAGGGGGAGVKDEEEEQEAASAMEVKDEPESDPDLDADDDAGGPAEFHHAKEGGVFWTMHLHSGNKTTVTWGILAERAKGEEPRVSEKEHKTAAHAKKFHDKKIAEKTAKGYVRQ